jgi:hypothetical protein
LVENLFNQVKEYMVSNTEIQNPYFLWKEPKEAVSASGFRCEINYPSLGVCGDHSALAYL